MNKAHLTAISRKKPSAPMKWLFDNYGPMLKGVMLDYGCGRGFDADYYGLKKFDPHYFPCVGDFAFTKFDWVFCNYVLNVIADEEERYKVIDRIRNLLKKSGAAYFTVRKNVKKEGFTSIGTFQANVELYLPIVKETSDYCIYKLEKVNL